MKRALLTALLAAAAALAACESSELKAPALAEGEERESEQEEDSDSAPFMIVVEHTSGRRCGASLVSLRTALTSAWCASSPSYAAPGELWALAPGEGAARRVARVALAAGAEAVRADHAWTGAAMDLALLELEAPFGGGGGADTRPILMATRPSECSAGATCHVVRALGRTPRLRIVDATLVAGAECSERWPSWAGLSESALCLVGATLCSSDWGTGVVCEGKLCGVLGGTTRAPFGSSPDGSSPGGADASCGDTHLAQSVAHRRRFLHCAHTLRVCGRGGDCGELCSERRLLDTDSANKSDRADGSTTRQATVALSVEPVDTTAVTATTPTLQRLASMRTSVSSTNAQSVPRPASPSSMKPTRSGPAPAVTTTTSTSTTTPPSQSSLRPAFEFEPNRADFKGGLARTSRVYLKAGEYGDNAAEYGGEEPLLPVSSKEPTTTAPAPPASSTPAEPSGPEQPSGRRDSAAAALQKAGAAAASPAAPEADAVLAEKNPLEQDKKTQLSSASQRSAISAYYLCVLVVITNFAN